MIHDADKKTVYNINVRSELKEKYFEAWGNAFSKKDDDISKPPVELVTVTRKSVAKANDVEFIAPVPQKKRSVSRSRKSKKKPEVRWKKFSWDYVYIAILLIVSVNLLFTSDGIIDLVSSKSRVLEGEKFLEQVQIDNMVLKSEIKKLQKSPKYQKKVAREHLGAIAKDEFLIIFSD